MAKSKWRGRAILENDKEGGQDGDSRAQELETRDASFPQKLQSNSSHNDKNSRSNRIVWSGTKNEVTRVEKDFARPSS
jgi:hypothetical protein